MAIMSVFSQTMQHTTAVLLWAAVFGLLSVWLRALALPPWEPFVTCEGCDASSGRGDNRSGSGRSIF